MRARNVPAYLPSFREGLGTSTYTYTHTHTHKPSRLVPDDLVYTAQCETPERSAFDDLGFGLAATALGKALCMDDVIKSIHCPTCDIAHTTCDMRHASTKKGCVRGRLHSFACCTLYRRRPEPNLTGSLGSASCTRTQAYLLAP